MGFSFWDDLATERLIEQRREADNWNQDDGLNLKDQAEQERYEPTREDSDV